jgi:transcriptional regulator with XRE-family HTH domain
MFAMESAVAQEHFLARGRPANSWGSQAWAHPAAVLGLVGDTAHNDTPDPPVAAASSSGSAQHCRCSRNRLAVVAPGFADRLNRLFEAIHPPGAEGPLSNQQVVRTLRARGTDISAPYLSQLRTGARQRPAERVVEALAEFFGIHAAYLLGTVPAYNSAIDIELDWLILGRDATVQRLTTLLLELSDDQINAILPG